MKQILIVLLLGLSFDCIAEKNLKVLHITLHNGCKKEFEEVGKELGIDVISWYVQELETVKGHGFWEGTYVANEIYNVGPRRAKRVWDKHKDFFNEFDVVVTSDTAPLSRIFLQNGWCKPLIIWVCNRFDYGHGPGGEDHFPDKGYYDLMRKAVHMNNVRVISYTPYEHIYAQTKGVDWGIPHTIKPIGVAERSIDNFNSSVPDMINQSDTFFIFPRLTYQKEIDHIQQMCLAQGIKTWSGIYNGPEDIKQFKGVLFFPYAFSNLALFENIQRGVLHFVPTKRFLLQLGFIWDPNLKRNLNWCEWYLDEFKDLIIYFDSWEELKNKVNSIDYELLRSKVKHFGKQHRIEMLQRWNTLFQEIML